MKLHGSPTSPYVRKARAALIEAGVPFEFQVRDVWAEEPAIAAMNPLGKVPVLVTHDDETIFDSFTIIDHVNEVSGGKLIPAEAGARRSVLWWHALAHGVLDAAVNEVLERRRPGELQSEDHVARERRRMARALEAADSRLDGEFLVGSRLTLADIALAVALEYLDFRIAIAWRDNHPRLVDWLAPKSPRPCLADTAPPRG